MVAFTAIIEPNHINNLNVIAANYRQILYRVLADSAVPPNQPMYADIYFDFSYYKTLVAYSIYVDPVSGFSIFDFDIQDAAQEFLQDYVPQLPVLTVQRGDPATPYSTAFCSVNFRGSSYSGGLLVPQGPIPVQATATTPPVPGGGLVTHQYIISNANINPLWDTIYDNANVVVGFMNSYETYLRSRMVNALSLLGATRIYPLSILPLNPFNTPDRSLAPHQFAGFNGGFPVHILQFGISGGGTDPQNRNCSAWLICGANGAMTNFIQMTAPALLSAPHTWYVPSGLTEITLLAGYSGIIPMLMDPSANFYYRVALYDEDAAKWCFFSPLFKPKTQALEAETLWFLNSQGHFEAVTFARGSYKFTTTSSEQFTSYTQDFNSSGGFPNALTLGRKRMNTRANDEIMLTTTLYSEALMIWMRDLMASPFVFQEIPVGGVLASSNNVFRAVEIVNDSWDVRKSVMNGRISYEISVKMRPAIDYAPLRN